MPVIHKEAGGQHRHNQDGAHFESFRAASFQHQIDEIDNRRKPNRIHDVLANHHVGKHEENQPNHR
ncbi:Uncharacterised protein [Vibrio cholerae]|nr:Uncharacterised protein [Vibrio cholerae]